MACQTTDGDMWGAKGNIQRDTWCVAPGPYAAEVTAVVCIDRSLFSHIVLLEETARLTFQTLHRKFI